MQLSAKPSAVTATSSAKADDDDDVAPEAKAAAEVNVAVKQVASADTILVSGEPTCRGRVS